MPTPIEQYSQLVAEVKMEVENAVNNDLPKLIGNKVVSLVKKNFLEEGYFGEHWEKVQRRMFRRYKTKNGYPYIAAHKLWDVCNNSRYIKKKSRGHRLSAIASKGVLSIFRPQKYN